MWPGVRRHRRRQRPASTCPERLSINGRWHVTLEPAPRAVYMGAEGDPGWTSETSLRRQWSGDDGWGYARLHLGSGNARIVVVDGRAQETADAAALVPAPMSNLDLALPDSRFTASLKAQAAHLLMGLVGRETRPGDPVNYPLAWQRDGAYAIAALAAAGYLDVSRSLATFMAENDFYGGFGPEADAPGLGIWALEQVATRVDDPDYDRWLWPHVRRKADFIVEMLSATEAIRRPVVGLVVPGLIDDPELTLVAEPASSGMIVGRMDGHRPLLYVNAVSYRGLLEAASLAERLGYVEDAARWRDTAEAIERAWEDVFLTRDWERENERTYAVSLWPTEIVDDLVDRFRQELDVRWRSLRSADGGFREMPRWTYFDIAEAHQWLRLGEPARAWTTLEWFWNHQESTGLYTWWEGDRTEAGSPFRRWEHVRGWVKPQPVTPHYWTAAEMLLLQLEMLAYIDSDAAVPTVVIGAGVPESWLAEPVSVRGLPLAVGTLDWTWDGRRVQVFVRGNSTPTVSLGPSFPDDTPVIVNASEP
jgi:hypothetical protein